MMTMNSSRLPLTAPAGSAHSLVDNWYHWMGFLPSPFRAVSLIVVGWVLLRLLFRYASKPLAALGRAAASGLVEVVTWVAIAPEYALDSVALRYWDRNLPGSFSYGETVAGFKDAGERTATRVAGRLGRLRFAPGKVAFWAIVAVLLIVNVVGYHAHAALPVMNWWHSVTAWVDSIRHHATPNTHRQAPASHHHRHHRHRGK
jgi:hypothetical protein